MSTNKYMTAEALNYLAEKIVWERGKDPEHPYATIVAGDKAVVRLNDFPDESLYTLIVNDVELLDFNDWPEPWKRP